MDNNDDLRYIQKMELTSVMVRDWDGVSSGYWISFVKEGDQWIEFNDSDVIPRKWSYVQQKAQGYGMVFKYNKKAGYQPTKITDDPAEATYQVMTKANRYLDFKPKTKGRYMALDPKSGKYLVTSGSGDDLKKYHFDPVLEDYVETKKKLPESSKSLREVSEIELKTPKSTPKNLSRSKYLLGGSLVILAISGAVGWIAYQEKLKEEAKNKKRRDKSAYQ